MKLDRIFEPRSIVVVGASAYPAKRGHQILRALGESGYEGRVYAVNPAGGRRPHRRTEHVGAAEPAA